MEIENNDDRVRKLTSRYRLVDADISGFGFTQKAH